jgi:hypothetical protein
MVMAVQSVDRKAKAPAAAHYYKYLQTVMMAVLEVLVMLG